jgi:hypothetical protein
MPNLRDAPLLGVIIVLLSPSRMSAKAVLGSKIKIARQPSVPESKAQLASNGGVIIGPVTAI